MDIKIKTQEMKEMLAYMSDEQAGAFLRVVTLYTETGETPEITDPVVGVAFVGVKRGIDKRRAAAARREARKQEKEAAQTADPEVVADIHADTTEQVEYADDVITPEVVEDTPLKKEKKKSKKFTKPTVDEVRAYVAEKGYNVDPEKFVNYYDSNGWHVGKTTMKDWQAAVRTWASNSKSNGYRNQQNETQNTIDFGGDSISDTYKNMYAVFGGR